jgi:hypothetical protein
MREGLEGKDDPDEAGVVEEAPRELQPPPADPPEREQRPA